MTSTKRQRVHARASVGLGLIAAGLMALLPSLRAGAATGVKEAIIDGTSNAFIRTDVVEVGARPNGSFGSNSVAPAGWHGNTTDAPGKIGFRADRTGDGWGVGVDDGDFFLPGTPYEGFSLQVNSTWKRNNHFLSEIAGGFVSTATSAEPTVVWQSSANVDGVSLKQTYSLPTNGSTFIRMSVTVTNNNGTSAEVYYARGVDPDNCRTRTTVVCDTNGDGVADSTGPASFGGYATLNKIEEQRLDGDSTSTVSASQTDGSILKLTTTDSESVVLQGALEYGCDFPKTIGTAYQAPRTYTMASRYIDANTCPWANKKNESKLIDDFFVLIVHRTLAPGASATFQIRYLLADLPLVEPTTTTTSTLAKQSTTSTTSESSGLPGTGAGTESRIAIGFALIGIGSMTILTRRRLFK